MSTVSFDRIQPYNSLPYLPPKVELETVPVLKKAIGATRALGELKGMGDVIPNQAVLLSTLALQEARLSSEIENIVTTNDELYRAFADDGRDVDPLTKEVLRYNSALWHGYQHLREGRPLSTNLFEGMASVIKEREIKVRNRPGTRIATPEKTIIYTPPEGEDLIRGLLYDLEKFIHMNEGLDPLVKLAIIHYQFEAIHPFPDGNGRTGRILNILYLVAQGLLEVPILYLSRYIIQHKSDYYSLLRRVTEEGAWEEWILYVLAAVEETAKETRDRIVSIKNSMDTVSAEIKEQLPNVYSKDLVEVLYTQPYCKIKFLEDAGIAKRQTASRYLQELERIGIVEGYRMGRDVYYMNTRFFALLS